GRPARPGGAGAWEVAVSVVPEGGATIALSLDAPRLDASDPLAPGRAELWLVLPVRAPATHRDSNIALAADLHDVKLPQAPSPFRNLLDELALGVTVKGSIPSGPPRQAATGWRDEGGTAEIDNLTLRWGTLAVSGSGTLALDSDLQPMRAFP